MPSPSRLCAALLLTVCLSASFSANAQVPVQAQPDHALLLASSDAGLAANKRLVYDFWREVFEGGQMDRVDRYLAEGYIQHNPRVPTGRAGFVEVFSKFAKPKPVEAKVQAPLVAITAEGDLVILSFVRKVVDAKDPSQSYTTTWFDMFRIENGRIAEHWDPATKP